MINNLAIARQAVAFAHPEEAVRIVHGKGFVNVKGKIVPMYTGPETVMAQIQNLSGEDLQHTEAVSGAAVTRKAYIFAGEPLTRPVERMRARTGDYVEREDGSYWLVTGLLEDFSKSGWVCVAMQEQVEIGPEVQAAFAEGREPGEQGGAGDE